MKCIKSALLWGLLLSLSTAYGQQTILNGTLLDEKGQGLEMANILVLSVQDSSMVTYGFTNTEGAFRFKLKTGEPVLLRATFMGYRPLDSAITPSGKSQELRLTLQPATEMLQEANVTENMPILISGDTISYKADAFATGNEDKLGELLKNMPGIEVDDNGEITVEGKKVDKVMVEGKDFFDGDSKIASKNIPAKSVDKVQVLKNYQEIAPLKGLSTEDRTALNIKLKEGQKNLWFGDYEVKGGDPERYFAHANGFLYTPKVSFNIIADANNLGEAPLSFMDYFRMSGGFNSMSRRSGSRFNFNLGNTGFALSDNNRALNTVSNFGAVNFSYNPSKALSISGFAIGSTNKTRGRNETDRTYIGVDSLNQENLVSLNNDNTDAVMGKLSLVYQPSENLQIIYDALGKITPSRQSQSRVSDFGDFENRIGEQNRQNPYEINQNFATYYDAGKSVYSLEMQYKVNQTDPRYHLNTTQLPFRGVFVFSDSSRYRLLQQQITDTRVLEGNAKYYYVINDMNHIEFSVGGSVNDQDFNSNIQEGDFAENAELEATQGNLSNLVDFRLADVYFGLHHKTRFGKFTFKPGANLHRYDIEFDQPLSNTATDKWLLLPDAYLKYELGKSESFTLRYNMEAQFNDVSQVMESLIIQSYNGLYRGSQSLDNATYHSASLRYYNYDMFNFSSTWASISYDRTIDGITNTVDFIGRERIFFPINAQGFNERISGRGRYSRKFKWFRVSGGGSLSYSTTNNVVNNRENVNETFTQRYSVGFETRFEKWPNLEMDYDFTVNEYSGTGANSTFTNHSPQFELTYRFWNDFFAEVEYEYNNYGNTGSDTRTTFDFLDASLEYQKKDSPWTFEIEVLNLLNTEFIRNDNLSNSLISTTAVSVLPRYSLMGVKYDL